MRQWQTLREPTIGILIFSLFPASTVLRKLQHTNAKQQVKKHLRFKAHNGTLRFWNFEGLAARRSALRANRGLLRAKGRRFTDEVRSRTLKERVPWSAGPRVTTVALRVSANRTFARFCVTR